MGNAQTMYPEAGAVMAWNGWEDAPERATPPPRAMDVVKTPEPSPRANGRAPMAVELPAHPDPKPKPPAPATMVRRNTTTRATTFAAAAAGDFDDEVTGSGTVSPTNKPFSHPTSPAVVAAPAPVAPAVPAAATTANRFGGKEPAPEDEPTSNHQTLIVDAAWATTRLQNAPAVARPEALLDLEQQIVAEVKRMDPDSRLATVQWAATYVVVRSGTPTAAEAQLIEQLKLVGAKMQRTKPNEPVRDFLVGLLNRAVAEAERKRLPPGQRIDIALATEEDVSGAINTVQETTRAGANPVSVWIVGAAGGRLKVPFGLLYATTGRLLYLPDGTAAPGRHRAPHMHMRMPPTAAPAKAAAETVPVWAKSSSGGSAGQPAVRNPFAPPTRSHAQSVVTEEHGATSADADDEPVVDPQPRGKPRNRNRKQTEPPRLAGGGKPLTAAVPKPMAKPAAKPVAKPAVKPKPAPAAATAQPKKPFNADWDCPWSCGTRNAKHLNACATCGFEWQVFEVAAPAKRPAKAAVAKAVAAKAAPKPAAAPAVRKNQWSCERCTTVNHVDVPDCESCGGARFAPAAAAADNDVDADDGGGDDAGAEEQAGDDDGDDAGDDEAKNAPLPAARAPRQWACGRCTYSNHSDMVVCESCAAPKPM